MSSIFLVNFDQTVFVAGVADSTGYGFAIAKACAEAGIVATHFLYSNTVISEFLLFDLWLNRSKNPYWYMASCASNVSNGT